MKAGVLSYVMRFERQAGTRSKYRFDFVAGSLHPMFQTDTGTKDGKAWVYLRENPASLTDWRRTPERAIMNRRGKYVAGLFMPDMVNTKRGFGTIGNDALLFEFTAENAFQVFVAIGHRYQVAVLFNLFTAGQLVKECKRTCKDIAPAPKQAGIFQP